MLYYTEPNVEIYCGDAREVLASLEPESVQCVITSPPYWGLRKYSGEQETIWGDGYCGGYGLEPNIEMYVEHSMEMLRAIRRVLRKDGVVFWNIGDSYSGGQRRTDKPQSIGGARGLPTDERPSRMMPLDSIVKPKDLCLIPFRIALAAQSGWWVRSVIIWSKPNPMPESVNDRPTTSHEYILMLTKSAKYYWDAEAVRERFTNIPHIRGEKMYDGIRIEHGWNKEDIRQYSGRNLRTVWTFPTEPYSKAHFATFPRELVRRCILAATSEKGNCPKCGKPWVRIQDYKANYTRRESARQPGNTPTKVDSTGWKHPTIIELGWKPQCQCGLEPVPALVLDPFSGSGTVGEVAKSLNRKAILIDISEEYCEMARKRIEAVPMPMEV